MEWSIQFWYSSLTTPEKPISSDLCGSVLLLLSRVILKNTPPPHRFIYLFLSNKSNSNGVDVWRSRIWVWLSESFSLEVPFIELHGVRWYHTRNTAPVHCHIPSFSLLLSASVNTFLTVIMYQLFPIISKSIN